MLRGPVSLTTSVLVGHIRSTAVDLLVSTGISHRESISMLEEAAGRAVDLGPPPRSVGIRAPPGPELDGQEESARPAA